MGVVRSETDRNDAKGLCGALQGTILQSMVDSGAVIFKRDGDRISYPHIVNRKDSVWKQFKDPAELFSKLAKTSYQTENNRVARCALYEKALIKAKHDKAVSDTWFLHWTVGAFMFISLVVVGFMGHAQEGGKNLQPAIMMWQSGIMLLLSCVVIVSIGVWRNSGSYLGRFSGIRSSLRKTMLAKTAASTPPDQTKMRIYDTGLSLFMLYAITSAALLIFASAVLGADVDGTVSVPTVGFALANQNANHSVVASLIFNVLLLAYSVNYLIVARFSKPHIPDSVHTIIGNVATAVQKAADGAALLEQMDGDGDDISNASV